MTKIETTLKDLNKILNILDEIFEDPENIYNHTKLVEIYTRTCNSITRLEKEKTHGKEKLFQTTTKGSK